MKISEPWVRYVKNVPPKLLLNVALESYRRILKNKNLHIIKENKQ